MKIVVVSVNHDEQLTQPKDHIELPYDDEEMGPLRRLVRELIPRSSIDLICEESNPMIVSVAQEEAFFHNPRIRWKNIMMTAQERLEAGIWCAILDCNRPTEENADTGATIYHRVPEDHIRENFFKDEIVKSAQEIDAKSVLVLCGDAHTESLKTKLEAAGYNIETNHDLIGVKDWK
jgi:hypothetical protein